MKNKHQFIVIEGNIGAGKTTLSKMLANELNANLILENFAENPFLPKFYKEPEKYAFQLETSFLIDRYEQLKQFHTPNLFKELTIADYYFSKSLIFAQNTLKDDEYNLYTKIFWHIYKSVPKPNIYVYLHLSVEKLLQNIAKRGRDYEKYITANYLEKIQNGYFNFFKQQKDIKFLIIDTNKIDFVANLADYQKIKETILSAKLSVGINKVSL